MGGWGWGQQFEFDRYSAVGADIEREPIYMDMNHNLGFLTSLTILHRLHEGGIMWLATVCSSWVWISRSSTSRSPEQPMGREDSQSVASGNIMTARSDVA